MGFSLNLCASECTRGPILDLWDAVGRIEGTSSMRALGYPPHVTLAIYDAAEVDAGAASTAFECCAAEGASVSLRFDGIRTFHGPPMVLWLAPDASDVLRSMHAVVHRSIEPRLCREHYRPGRWTPHCTLGTRIGPEGERAATDLIAAFGGGLDVTFDTLECVRFPPLEALLRCRWAVAGPSLRTNEG